MGKKLNVILISGPRCGGKSTLIRMLVPSLCARPPHYLRLVPVEGRGPRLTLLGDLKSAGLASWKRVNYDANRIFEFLPECLEDIASAGGSRNVLVEADADPNLRYAFSYDHRVFVLPTPRSLEQVFRTPSEAAQALREVMDDTAAFASEIFGLFDPEADEDDGVNYERIQRRGAIAEERLEITPLQMRRFMNSPLGSEVASRIQLQPDYHGLMDSEVILLNLAIGGKTPVVPVVISRIETLIQRLGSGRLNNPELLMCDPLDPSDPSRAQLIDRLRGMLVA